MKNSEIRELTTKEILERIDNERSYLQKLRLNHAVSPVDNPNKITIAKRNIARLLTELGQRERTEKQNS
jgi:large subunit ribosomal protein L29